MRRIHFLSVKADGASPFAAARGLFHINIEFQRSCLVQLKKEIQYIGKISDGRCVGLVAQNEGRRGIEDFCQSVYNIDGNLDFSGFIFLYGAQRLAQQVCQLRLVQPFVFS